ncbi:MAG: hypothetical protein RJP95_04295, partial [Pirellulales bacterium]
ARKLTKDNAQRFPLILNRAEALVDGGEVKTARQELAVLAFAGLSGDAKQRYEALLARIKSLAKENEGAEKGEEGSKPEDDKVSSSSSVKGNINGYLVQSGVRLAADLVTAV